MRSIKYAQRAISDLEDSTDYTSRRWGSKQAKSYLRDIRLRIVMIANGDAITQPFHLARGEVFKCRINRHLIIFDQTNNQVRIVRILHEAMDMPGHLGL